MEFNVGEAYDLTTGHEMKKKKDRKRLVLWIILVVIILLGIIGGIMYSATYMLEHEIKALEEDEGEITAVGNYYSWAVGVVDDFQREYLKNRNILVELSNDMINEDATYISNQRIFIYDDGTYFERTSEFYKGEHSDNCVIGTMNIDNIKDYLHQNEEVFKGMYKIEEKYREEEEAMGKTFIAHYNGCFAIVEEERYQKQLYSIYLAEDKEVVQNYDISNIE